MMDQFRASDADAAHMLDGTYPSLVSLQQLMFATSAWHDDRRTAKALTPPLAHYVQRWDEQHGSYLQPVAATVVTENWHQTANDIASLNKSPDPANPLHKIAAYHAIAHYMRRNYNSIYAQLNDGQKQDSTGWVPV